MPRQLIKDRTKFQNLGKKALRNKGRGLFTPQAIDNPIFERPNASTGRVPPIGPTALGPGPELRIDPLEGDMRFRPRTGTGPTAPVATGVPPVAPIAITGTPPVPISGIKTTPLPPETVPFRELIGQIGELYDSGDIGIEHLHNFDIANSLMQQNEMQIAEINARINDTNDEIELRELETMRMVAEERMRVIDLEMQIYIHRLKTEIQESYLLPGKNQGLI